MEKEEPNLSTFLISRGKGRDDSRSVSGGTDAYGLPCYDFRRVCCNVLGVLSPPTSTGVDISSLKEGDPIPEGIEPVHIDGGRWKCPICGATHHYIIVATDPPIRCYQCHCGYHEDYYGDRRIPRSG